jgi:hypothetical protein
MHARSSKSARGLLLILAVLSLVRFGHEVNRIRAGGFVDFPIFWQQAERFLETGRIYPESDDLSQFRPRAEIYKFPPIYMTLLVPLATLGIGSSIFVWHWLAQILAYVATGWLCFLVARPARPRLFLLLLSILLLNFEPFFETLYGLQVETFLLLLVALCLLFAVRRLEAGAGLALSAAAMLKIYPFFLLSYFVARARWLTLLWVASGSVILLALSLVVIGPSENWVYFASILPFILGENPDAYSQNLGLGRYLQTVVGMTPESAKAWTRGLVLAPFLATALWVHRAAGTPRCQALAFTLFLPLMLLALPNSWSNYQLFLLLPLSVLLAHVLESGPRVRLVLALAAPAYASLLFSENTPYLLSVIPIPEPLYSAILSAKVLGTLLIWVAGAVALLGYGPVADAVKELPDKPRPLAAS